MTSKSARKVPEEEKDTMRKEYRRKDLGKGVRGKYAAKFSGDQTLAKPTEKTSRTPRP